MDGETRTTAGQVMGIIGIVLAVISLILAFIPCVGIVAFLPAGIAIIFSIISILQATKGYGSKGLGIGALIVSVFSVIVALVWFAIFSGSIFFNKTINENSKFDFFDKDFKTEFKRGFDNSFDEKETTIRIKTDSLENTLRKLESETKTIEITIDNESPSKNSNHKKKKTTTITIKSDSDTIKVKNTR